MNIKKMKSTLRCYIFMIIFVGGGMSLMVFSGQAAKSIKPVRIDRAVTIEQPKKMEKIVYKFKPIDLEFKLLIY